MQTPENTAESDNATAPLYVKVIKNDGVLRACIVGMFLIAVTATLYLAREFFLPVFAALILALTLNPAVRKLSHWGIPSVLSAVTMALTLAAGLGLAVFFLSEPVEELINEVPQYQEKLRSKLEVLKAPLEAAEEVEDGVNEMTSTDADGDVQEVVIKGSGILANVAGGALEGLLTFTIMLVLLVFLLGSGDMFYRKLINVMPRLQDKKRALRIVYDIEQEVSRYLLSIGLINVILGMVVATVMFVLGMPMPIVWGVMATLLNFIPYLGAVIGVVIVTSFALVQFDPISTALLVGASYYLCTFIEGQFITPLALGRRLSLNPVMLFVFVAFWAWLWGVAGALIAVPILVVVKVFASHFESLAVLTEFLSGGAVVEEADDQA